MNKVLPLVILLFLGTGGFLIYHIVNKPEPKPLSVQVEEKTIFDGGLFEIAKLDPSLLAQSGEETLAKTQFQDDPQLKALEEEKRELIILSLLKNQKINEVESIVFYIPQLTREILSLLNQYGLEKAWADKIAFEPKESEFVAQVDKKDILLSEIPKDSFHWGAVETKKFRRYLELVLVKLQNKLITQSAKKNNMSSEEFILGKVGNQDPKEVRQYVIDHLITKPIKINLQFPNFTIELKPDWTPFLGFAESSEQMIVFDSFYSQSGRNFINQVEALAQKYPNKYFGFRPVFSKKDRFQSLLGEVSFCIWALQKEFYWPFLKKAVDIKPKKFEQDVYGLIAHLGMDLSSIKKCFYEQKYKKVVSYHLDYAEFLNIKAGPIVFYKGEVYSGELSLEKLDQLLNL